MRVETNHYESGVGEHDDTGLTCECGIFGLYLQEPSESATSLAALALFLQKNRGIETTGISYYDLEDQELRRVISEGLVDPVKAMTNIAISHGRYATFGNDVAVESVAQPYITEGMSFVHNGQITNTRQLLDKYGKELEGPTDSITAANIIASQKSSYDSVGELLQNVLPELEGAYSLLVATNNELYGARDPHGFRPLNLFRDRNNWAFASESFVATKMPGYFFDRPVEPGEVVQVSERGLKSYQIAELGKRAACGMEFAYFGMPASYFEGQELKDVRYRIGRELALRDQQEGFDFSKIDVVFGVPLSGLPYADGYSEVSNIRQTDGIQLTDSERTFIQPIPGTRAPKVRQKHTPYESVVKGKNILVTDDSLVRGNTMLEMVDMLKRAGAKEIHLRFGFPPIVNPCFYGIDIPDSEQLIARTLAGDPSGLETAIARYLNVNSAKFIIEDSFKEVVGQETCMACVDGDYPTPVPVSLDNLIN